MKQKIINGLSFWVAIGSYGGFHMDYTGICFGWVSIRLVPLDIENVLENLITENKYLKAQIEREGNGNKILD